MGIANRETLVFNKVHLGVGGAGGFKEVYVWFMEKALWGNDPVTQFHKYCPLRFDHIFLNF